jgi:tricorn protease-like protein
VILSTRAALYIVDLKSLSITRNGDGAERIIQENSSVFLVRDGSLVGFNVTLKTSYPIMDVQDYSILSISPNGKKAAVLWDNKTLEIYDMDADKSLRFDLSDLYGIKDIFWHKASGYVFILSGNSLHYLYIEKENMEPSVIYEGLEQAKYSDGELFTLSGREIKTSRF